MRLPEPIITQHDRFWVVRDDLIVGGTKVRALCNIFQNPNRALKKVAYACDLYGHAPIALIEATKIFGIELLLFFPRLTVTPTYFAMVTDHYHVKHLVFDELQTQNDVYERGQEIANDKGYHLFPIGFNNQEFLDSLVSIAQSLQINPHEAWSIAGSGCLNRAMQIAWPMADIHAVSMGFPHGRYGRAVVHNIPQKTNEEPLIKPPYPSAKFYDAKIWQFVIKYGSDNALIWNVS